MQVVRNRAAKGPTPYLRRMLPIIKAIWGHSAAPGYVIDLGCGNGRNSEYIFHEAYHPVIALDQCPDYEKAIQWRVGDPIPLPEPMLIEDLSGGGPPRRVSVSISLVLCQYLLMFLEDGELIHLAQEINRITSSGVLLLIEIYKVKSGRDISWEYFRDLLLARLDPRWDTWDVVHSTKERCLLKRRTAGAFR